MSRWSIPLGRLLGVEIRVNWTFLALLLLLLAESTRPGTVNGDPGRSLALCAIVFLSVALHELGHALAATYFGLRQRLILLFPIGGLTQFATGSSGELPGTPAAHVVVALAGPAINLLAAGVSALLVLSLSPHAALLARPYIEAANLVRSAIWLNLCLALLNLLPAYPLDMGRVLREMFLHGRSQARATRAAVGLGQLIAFLIVGLGAWQVNVFLMLIGICIMIAGQMEDQGSLFQSVVENVHMEDVMLTEFATLSPADTLEDALRKAVHCLQDDFPVVRGSLLVGTVSRRTLVEALQAHGNGYVQGVMQRVLHLSRRGDPLSTVLRRMRAGGSTLVPVIDGDRLIGIVTLQNLMHSMSLLAEARRLRRVAEQE